MSFFHFLLSTQHPNLINNGIIVTKKLQDAYNFNKTRNIPLFYKKIKEYFYISYNYQLKEKKL